MQGSFLSGMGCGQVVVEAMESRRLLSGTFVTPVSVNLAVQRVNAPACAIRENGNRVLGQPASVRIQNAGNETAIGTVGVRFYLSTDQVLDAGDVLAGVVAPHPIHLNPGHSQLFTAKLLPPPGLPVGRYYLFAVESPGGGIVQNDTSDEVGLAAHTVRIVEGHFRTGGIGQANCYNDFYDGSAINLCQDEVVTQESTPVPSTSNDESTQPATQPASAPTSEPTTDPSSDQTTPVDNGGWLNSDSTGGSFDSSGSSDSGGADSSGGDVSSSDD